MQDNPFLAHLNADERKLLHKVAAESLLHSRFSPDPALDSLIERGYLKTSEANLAGHVLVRLILVRLTEVGRDAAELLIYEAFPFPEQAKLTPLLSASSNSSSSSLTPRSHSLSRPRRRTYWLSSCAKIQ